MVLQSLLEEAHQLDDSTSLVEEGYILICGGHGGSVQKMRMERGSGRRESNRERWRRREKREGGSEAANGFFVIPQ